jgi:hypothetical protein
MHLTSRTGNPTLIYPKLFCDWIWRFRIWNSAFFTQCKAGGTKAELNAIWEGSSLKGEYIQSEDRSRCWTFRHYVETLLYSYVVEEARVIGRCSYRCGEECGSNLVEIGGCTLCTRSQPLILSRSGPISWSIHAKIISRDGGIQIVSNLSCIAWLAANFRSWLVSLLLR